MEPLEPRPPDLLPTRPVIVVPHPTPRLPYDMWQEKPIWKSRTILSLAVAIGALVLGWFGIDGIDIKAIADDHVLTLGELVTLIFGIAAAVFRVKATGPLTTPKPPSAG